LNLDPILSIHHKHFKRLCLLLGIQALCKELQTLDFEKVVNQYEIEAKHWHLMVEEILYDDSFMNLLSGELFETYTNLKLWQEKREPYYKGRTIRSLLNGDELV
jgi:hypothetical protein